MMLHVLVNTNVLKINIGTKQKKSVCANKKFNAK